MPYQPAMISRIEKAPMGLGKKLGLQAVRLNFSVGRIAAATGATRQTVYNWFNSGTVAIYYDEKVCDLLQILTSHNTAENAWRAACSHFRLKA